MSGQVLSAGAIAALQRERTAAAFILRGGRKFRRLGDSDSTYREAKPMTAGISRYGLTVMVIGFTDGRRDPGLNCRDCPLSDLIPMEETNP